MCPKVRKMAQIVMWVGLVVAGITLVILIFSTTSNNLSLSFNTNLYHFLNFNGTKQSPVVHNSFDVLPSGADQGSCAHKCLC